MGEFYKAAAVASSVLALGALGCGGAKSTSRPESIKRPAPLKLTRPHRGPAVGKPRHGALHCEAEQIGTWVPVPPNLNKQAIAQRLGVSASEVDAGKLGPAHCEEAIYASQVGSLAHVKGVGAVCLTVGIMSGNRPPQSGVKYNEVMAFCASNGEL